MPAASRQRGYNGLHAGNRSYGIDSPCCSRFERRILSVCHALVATVICASAGVLPKYWNTYLGHVGPGAVMYILSELERYPGDWSGGGLRVEGPGGDLWGCKHPCPCPWERERERQRQRGRHTGIEGSRKRNVSAILHDDEAMKRRWHVHVLSLSLFSFLLACGRSSRDGGVGVVSTRA